MARAEEYPESPKDAAGAEVAVTGTGRATAASEATAVTGYHGPAPGIDGVPAAPVRVSRTGQARASDGGLANAGYIHQLTVVQRALRESAPWPHQVGVIPSRAQSFQHRAEAENLRAAVDGGGTVVLRQVPVGLGVPHQVLTGTGGVGKTQLAADYARTAWDDGSLDVLVWVTASARSSVISGYAQAAVELCQVSPEDPERAARTFLAWLTPKAGATPCRWLIVLDDVADPDDLRGLWPPASGHGRILITTRRRDAALTGDGRRLIEVGLFTEPEALAYLTASLAAHGRHASVGQLAALAADLGYLPLALAQAAAYLIDSGDDIPTYRALLADRATGLADTAPDVLPDEQVIPLAVAWSLSLERADRLRPPGLARPMLHLVALLDPHGIPEAVLTSEPVLTHLAQHRTRTGRGSTGAPAPVSARDAVRALRALYRLSLIDHAPDVAHQTVRVHQLIQRATLDTLSSAQHHQLARTAADAILGAWPDIERDTALAQALRANTNALTSHSEDALYRPDAHEVLFRTGTSLGEAGQVADAIVYWRRLLGTADSAWGPDHPGTLRARGRLLRWQAAAGDRAGAATAYAALLQDMTRVLGATHPDTLRTCGALVWWQGWAGDHRGAAEASAALLQDMIAVLGPDHPDTLRTRATLAWWRGQTGDPAGAAATYAEVLAGRLRMVGADHPDTLRTRSYLAWWQGRAADPAGSAEASAALLQDMIRVLGPDHPDTLRTRNNLHFMQGVAGDIDGAVNGFEQLLPDMARVLGTDHPDTVASQRNWAWLQQR
ncbi:tetratricopeptide repeat protein [Streptomyces albipurpureus]|uniref:Tetratricopeptide repeat protein n=1 Tax=Streptomyces albipurpureus TaxID=2897419 RepID=A0ABT0URL7_9ACTN|nr:tetratricopeptide repeat protein [Streptomyces sp. CWNU-1]MCM2390725.1 tetratricopeptide repeat protein [Streptomyces sp. CWNU-1]